MYMRALSEFQQARGFTHTSTLDTFNNLDVLYRNQGKLEQAEKIYIPALNDRIHFSILVLCIEKLVD